MKILRLYLLREQTQPFFLGLLFFTFMFSLGNTLKLAELFVKRTVGFSYLLKFSWYMFVGSLNFSIPLAIFAATIIIFARFSVDYEISAISSAGINLYSFLFPLLIIGLFLSSVTFYFNNVTSPNLQFSTRKMVTELEVESPANLIQEGTFIRDFKNIILFARKVKDKKISDITIYKFNGGRELSTINAKRGKILSPQKGKIILHLADGFIQTYDSSHPREYTNLRFKLYNFILKKSADGQKKRALVKKTREYTLGELIKEKRIWQKKGIKNIEILSEIQKRASFSFAPFIFILLGIPLGIVIKHSGKFLDFTVLFLAIFLYYFFSTVGEILGRKLLLPVLLWLPNVLFGGVGIFLLTKRVKK